jgi:hypothetical protein
MSVLLKQYDGVVRVSSTDPTLRELHLEDMTIEHITDALEYYKHQRSLQQAKYRRLYVPTGKPIGRPRKNPKAEESDQHVVKKSVGRPKKEKTTTETPTETPTEIPTLTGQDS